MSQTLTRYSPPSVKIPPLGGGVFPPHPENPKENPVTQQTLGPNQVKPK